MLKLAVKSGLPLIAISTTDTLNVTAVLKHVVGKTPLQWKGSATDLVKKGQLLYSLANGSQPANLEKLYEAMVRAEASLIVVNPKTIDPLMFNAGQMPVPRDMVRRMLVGIFDDEDLADDLLPALGGCTIKEAVEFARLTMARDRSLTPQGMMLTRKSSFQGTQGVTLIDTETVLYAAPGFLDQWIERERSFFLDGDDPRLVPRGVLADGPPGTGKTMAARYIASRFGVPLYRVDIAGAKKKYIGESERNLSAALSQLDREQPCVALFDEIEKIFGGTGEHDSGTTTAMLSQLLWWLAERRSRVLVVMTTNNRGKLPPELYREGRIDDVFCFNGLAAGAARAFAAYVVQGFPQAAGLIGAEDLEAAVAGCFGAALKTDPPTVSHAAVAKVVYALVKQAVVKAK